MDCKFVVGQKVVCIADKWGGPQLYLAPFVPAEGNAYTIREIFTENNDVGLRLKEIVCGIGYRGIEPGWHSSNFRPVEERKTDISILEKLLNPKNHKILEGV